MVKNTIISNFNDTVKVHNASIGLVVDKKKYTYHELDELSNGLANTISECICGIQNPILVFDDHPLQVACTILGVMKSRNIIVPVSKKTPVHRLLEIIDTCNIKGYISLDEHQELNSCHIPVKYNKIKDYSYTGDENDDAYIIYTSGTTGKSKGVLVQHKGILNSVLERNSILGINSNSSSVNLMGFSFDGFFMSFLSPLLAGGTLYLPKNVADYTEVCSILKENFISNFLCTPTFLNSLLIYADDKLLDNISLISLAGEPVSLALIEKFVKKYPFIQIANEYGPTENSICTSINPDIRNQSVISTGKVIKNVEAKIFSDTRECSQKEIGELYLAGIGLAKGYVNDEELTKRKFLLIDGKTWYRTGDLAYWDHDELIISGRVDKQVKVNGYRIDLSEIENVIQRYDGINSCVVNYNSIDGMTAYWTSSYKINHEEIIKFLRKHINDYMLPANYIQVPNIPMLESGKIDYVTLRELGKSCVEDEVDLTQSTKTTDDICTLFKEVLQLDKCTENSNFFACGGNSLLAVILCARIKDIIGISVDVEELRMNPTPRLLINNVINSINEDVYVELKPFNKFWFIDCYFTSILSVLEYYAIPIAPFIRAFKILNIETNDSYSLYYDYTKPMIEIMSDLGIMFKPGILEDNFDEQILSCIKARRVVMLHVDCYYLPYCKEKYQKEHFEHVITLIGYDNLSKEFDIIDQENLSSVSFGYHKAHLDDVRIAAYEEIVNRETFDNMDFVSFSQFRKWEDTNQECLEESQFNYVIDKTLEYIENNVTDIVHVLQLLLNYIKIEKSVFQYMLDDNTVQYLQKKEVQIMRFMMKIVAHKKNDGKILEDLVHVLKNWDRLL